MAVFVPSVQTGYFLEGLFSMPKWQRLLASGVLDMDTLQNAVPGGAKVGDTIKVPKISQAADFSRIDISSAVDLSFTDAATLDDVAVVMRDASPNQWKKHDELRSGENFFDHLSTTAGNKAASRLITQLSNVLIGAIQAIDSPETNAHLEDQTGSVITVAIIRAAKARLGDQGQNLSVALIHSHVWYDLVKALQSFTGLDLIGGASIAGGDMVIESPGLQMICGVGTWIISDDLTSTAAGFSTDDDDVYHTILLAPGSVFFAYQREPDFETDIDINKPSTLNKMKIGMDYVLHLRGTAWGGNTNPTDANLRTPGNWTQVTEDHRNVGAVLIKTAGQSGA